MSDWPPSYDALDDEPLWVECDDCKGDGWIWDLNEEKDCPACHGKGEVPNPNLTPEEQAALWDIRNKD